MGCEQSDSHDQVLGAVGGLPRTLIADPLDGIRQRNGWPARLAAGKPDRLDGGRRRTDQLRSTTRWPPGQERDTARPPERERDTARPPGRERARWPRERECDLAGHPSRNAKLLATRARTGYRWPPRRERKAADYQGGSAIPLGHLSWDVMPLGPPERECNADREGGRLHRSAGRLRRIPAWPCGFRRSGGWGGGCPGNRSPRAWGIRYHVRQVMSASAKPRLAGRQPSCCGGVLRVMTGLSKAEGKRDFSGGHPHVLLLFIFRTPITSPRRVSATLPEYPHD